MKEYNNGDFKRIGMIEFDQRFSVPEAQELIEEISDMCWGNVKVDEREPYTYHDTLGMLKEFERKALAFDKFRELLDNSKGDQSDTNEDVLELLDLIHKEVNVSWSGE